MVKYYQATDFKTALHVSGRRHVVEMQLMGLQDMHTGRTIKPVLVW